MVELLICSKNPINQATSKAMLTQIISIVFRRMETDLVGYLFLFCTHANQFICIFLFIGKKYCKIELIKDNFQVTAPSSSAGNSEASSQEHFEAGVESDQNEKTTTLGDALSQAKESSLASVEELQSLAGGADIKVNWLSSSIFCDCRVCSINCQV